MARKKLSKRAKGRAIAEQIEKLGERYLKRHQKLASMLRRKYVKTSELYEESPQDIDRVIRVMAKRLRMGVGLPKTRKSLLSRLRKMTRRSVASIKKEVVAQQRDEWLEALRNMGDELSVIESLASEIDKIGWNKFFNSKYYVPISNYGSPRLARFISSFGESPMIQRMRDFVNEQSSEEEETETEE